MEQVNKYFLIYVIWLSHLAVCTFLDSRVITKFTTIVKTTDVILFSCTHQDMLTVSSALMDHNRFVQTVHLESNYSMRAILTRHNYARTAVVVNTSCRNTYELLSRASSGRYFNKTYQWLLWDLEHKTIDALLPFEMDYVGPNAQITYVNRSQAGAYSLWDIHSKGRHLKSAFEIHLIGQMFVRPHQSKAKWWAVNDIFKLQSIRYRDQFNGLTLRGASVIDQENITTNAQIEKVLARPTKDAGVAAFIKYHYELLAVLRERFNFTVNYRNARGWAGRLGNTTFRLGFLGIIKRNEADVGASGIFNRINRFAEFDTIHQSWKFEAAFLYRFTPDLDSSDNSGNFLAPFDVQVWLLSIGTILAMTFIWRLVEWLIERQKLKTEMLTGRRLAAEQRLPNEHPQLKWQKWWQMCLKIFAQPTTQNYLQIVDPRDNSETSLSGVSLKTFGAVCQQGMDPIPTGVSSRTIVMTIFLFTLVMYNYYTSSVVGGLLSSGERGPATVDEVVSSPLKLSFEDIGYYKVLFRESTLPTVTRLISRKLSTARGPNELPVYSHVEEAVPYLKAGGTAFHCEVVDAYPEIAKLFDANEICDLRVVSGLLKVEIINWVVHKNSQYSEIFKVAMCHAREIGLVERLLRQRQPKKPVCQSLYTVYPVSLSGVLSAFFMLLGGALLSLVALGIEIYIKKYRRNFREKTINQLKALFKN